VAAEEVAMDAKSQLELAENLNNMVKKFKI